MNAKQLEQYVTSNEYAVVIMGSSGCGHCVKTKSVLPEFKRRFPKVVARFVEVGESENLARSMRVSLLPTIFFFAHGQRIGRLTGEQDVDGLARLLPRGAR